MKAVFAGVETVDEAIAYLERIKKKLGGKVSVTFGDGSPIAIVVTDGFEGSLETLPKPVVQIRLDRK